MYLRKPDESISASVRQTANSQIDTKAGGLEQPVKLVSGGQGKARQNLTPSQIIGLQQTVGNRAVMRLLSQNKGKPASAGRQPPVQRRLPEKTTQKTPRLTGEAASNTLQRYFKLSNTDYTGKHEFFSSKPKGGNMFDVQSLDPFSLKKKSHSIGKLKVHSLQHNVEEAKSPNLLVADDKTLAINDTKDEAKEFYATDAVVENSNKELRKVESPVLLDNSAGISLTVKDGPPLKKVSPLNNKKGRELIANEFSDFVKSRCIDIAYELMGGKSSTKYEAVFNNPESEGKDETSHKITPNPSGDAIPEANKLAQHLGEGGEVESLDLGKTLKGEAVKDPAGEKYGKKLGKGALDKEAKKLGINQYARAKVGEGYTTATIGAKKGSEDFSQLIEDEKPTVRTGSMWGYHFAAVTAESEDKKDHITLENYNRAGDMKILGEQLVKKLMLDLAPKMKQFKKQTENYVNDRDKVRIVLQELKKKAGLEEQQAVEETNKLLDPGGGRLWFFKMYGSLKGQSFHEAQANSGFFANPLTLRVHPEGRGKVSGEKEGKEKIEEPKPEESKPEKKEDLTISKDKEEEDPR